MRAGSAGAPREVREYRKVPMPDPPCDTSSGAPSPTPVSDSDGGRVAVDPHDLVARRGRVALWLALLGIPTAGITAIAGFGLGLAGLGDRPRGRSIAAVVVSLMVIVGWMGGLAGALEAMRARMAAPPHILNAESALARELAARVAREIDPAEPVPPTGERLAQLLETVPARFRQFGDPPEALAVEPDRLLAGLIARWWIAPPADPAEGSRVTTVVREPGRTGLFMFAPDGREVWSFKRAFDPTKATWDDREAAILEATRPAAEAIIAVAGEQGGDLPDAVAVAAILGELGPGPHPTYRRRPGGLFDLVVPGRREFATYAAFGGLLIPVVPEG